MRRLLIALGGVIAAFFVSGVGVAAEREAYIITLESPGGHSSTWGAEGWCDGIAAPTRDGVFDACAAVVPRTHVYTMGADETEYTAYFVGRDGGELKYEAHSSVDSTIRSTTLRMVWGWRDKEENTCESFAGQTEFVRITGEQALPGKVGIAGCEYELYLPGFCMPTSGGNDNDICGGMYRGTGEPYGGGGLPGGSEPEPMPPGDDQICATGENGNTVCVDRPDPDSGQQCGTMNGQPMCLDTLPKNEGDCRYVNGTWACGGDQSDVPRPPDPDAPVDDEGKPAEGDTINITNNNTVNNNIDNSKTTIGRGSRAGTGDGDQNDDEPGTCTDDPATPQDECGNLVKIDESGTPEGQERADALVGDGGLGDAMDEYIEQIGQPLGDEFTDVPEWEWSFGGGGACQPIPWSFGGSSGGWDGYCDFWEGDVKPVLNWFFTFLTALHIWGVWRTANRGV